MPPVTLPPLKKVSAPAAAAAPQQPRAQPRVPLYGAEKMSRLERNMMVNALIYAHDEASATRRDKKREHEVGPLQKDAKAWLEFDRHRPPPPMRSKCLPPLHTGPSGGGVIRPEAVDKRPTLSQLMRNAIRVAGHFPPTPTTACTSVAADESVLPVSAPSPVPAAPAPVAATSDESTSDRTSHDTEQRRHDDAARLIQRHYRMYRAELVTGIVCDAIVGGRVREVVRRRRLDLAETLVAAVIASAGSR